MRDFGIWRKSLILNSGLLSFAIVWYNTLVQGNGKACRMAFYHTGGRNEGCPLVYE